MDCTSDLQCPFCNTLLKEALYNHQQWHSGLMRTLTCGLPPDKRDVNPAAS